MTDEIGVGREIARLRGIVGMTQREFALAVGRSTSWVSQIEQGTLPVERLPVLQAVSRVLGVVIQVELRPDGTLLMDFTDEEGEDW